jgi:hypothetical protein
VNFTRKMASLSVVGVLAAGVAVTVDATPASAEQVDPNCNRGDYCVFKDANYGGGLLGFPGNVWTYTYYNYSYCGSNCGVNDSVSSAKNLGTPSGPTVVHSWRDAGYSGAELWTLYIGQYLSYVGDGNNDVASSHNWNYF